MSTVTKDTQAFKRAYSATGTIQSSMIAAGYSDNSSKMGRQALPKELNQWLDRKLKRAEKQLALGRSMTATDQENFVRGSLMDNALEGKDRAVRSLELLGKDRKVSMFTPESAAGIITISFPQSLVGALASRLNTSPALVLEAGTDGDSE